MFYKKYGKKFFDILIILVTAPIIFPLILLISLIVLFFNGTPIFYKAERVGVNYKLFTMYVCIGVYSINLRRDHLGYSS